MLWTRFRIEAIAGCVAAALSLLAGLPADAQSSPKAPVIDKPFAEHHLAIQLSDSDPKKEALTISVAYNLLKFYGPDQIAIEVVTFGPGIDLLRAGNSNRALVDSLVSQGVQFDVCMNTVNTVERETGKHVDLNPHAVKVEAGVAQILALTEKGFTLVRP
jgi:intracellular sulfur oxidation DsrE/DsrF family protein